MCRNVRLPHLQAQVTDIAANSRFPPIHTAGAPLSVNRSSMGAPARPEIDQHHRQSEPGRFQQAEDVDPVGQHQPGRDNTQDRTIIEGTTTQNVR